MAVPARSRGTAAIRAKRSLLARQVLLPRQAIIHSRVVSGVVLFAAAVLALLVANSPWSETYAAFRDREISIDLVFVSLSLNLKDWVNDGLMTVFFFVVGLEIKRELLHGELNTWEKAALPLFGALGGMAVPASVYLAFTWDGPGRAGWGIPMATDIAFALAVLALLGKRIPSQLRVFLLALATVDDIGAILVIAIFYTTSFSLPALGWAGGLLGAVLAMRWIGIRGVHYYVVMGAGFWLALQQAGVHPTIAGVLLGLVTPADAWFDYKEFLDHGRELISRFEKELQRCDEARADALLGHLEELARETEAPLERLERLVQPWVSFIVLPFFALVNAGIELSAGTVASAAGSPIAQGCAAGLLLGKVGGIWLACWGAIRTGAGRLPSGVTLRHVGGVGVIAGIGFTVALFITGLAFQGAEAQAAKFGVLAASLLAGLIGWLVLRLQTVEPESAAT
jgi:NhaA family Na+:H+ antiporter